MLLRVALAVIGLGVVAACGGGSNENSSEDPGVVRFTNALDDEVELEVEFAASPDERARGLMNRESLPENSGMLFVYPEDHDTSFWMRNTLIPLSIAFVLADGTIIDIQEMEPQTDDLHSPGTPYRYAIEANQGWFVDNWITTGIVAELPTERIEELLAEQSAVDR